MASNPPGSCCVVGVKHEGESKGSHIKVGKYAGYLATPDASNAHDGAAILYLPDVFSIWSNSELMADQFAANGYLTLIIDLFNGDPIPSTGPPQGFDFNSWFTKGSSGDNPHTKEIVDSIVVEAIKYLKEEKGVKKLGAVGYCFGAKYVARHANDGIDVGYFAHPSFVDEDELENFKKPLSIAAAETDTIFPTEKRHKSEEILAKTGVPYQINLYSGVEHGFAVRGDMNKAHVKYAKEQAFVQAVIWFNQWLA